MKKTILLLSFISCCLAAFSQKQICVDGSSSGSGDGSASNPYRTIQAAVDAASNGDIIQVAKGTYAEAVQIVQKKVQLRGGFAGSGNFTSADPLANVTIINGTDAKPCISVYIDVAISGSLIINGFTIRNGQRGIELSGGWSGKLDNITIENNIIENNGMLGPDEWGSPQRGGGIGLEGNNVSILNNLIRNNQSGRGAAIGVTDDPTNFLIADNRIENNKGYDDHAGGVSINGTGTITRNIFDGNVAAESLGWGWGGALLIFADSETTTSVSLSHNVYCNNHAPDRGGAVFVDDGASVQMEHELFYNNTSGKSGSAIYVDADWENNPSVLSMNNCTVSGNSTDANEAALFVEASNAQVQNCIFWNNGSDFELAAGGHLTVNYTLTQQGCAGTANISSNPLFANAASGDFHVQSTNGRFNPSTGTFVNDAANSPAIDAGNPASDYSNEPAPNGGRVNLGCYGNTPEASKSAGTGMEKITPGLWTIFPNPAKENIIIRHLPIGSSVNIIKLSGKTVYSSIIKNEQTTISAENFEDGVYIIQVTDNGAAASRKLVVSK